MSDGSLRRRVTYFKGPTALRDHDERLREDKARRKAKARARKKAKREGGVGAAAAGGGGGLKRGYDAGEGLLPQPCVVDLGACRLRESSSALPWQLAPCHTAARTMSW